jgi:hypothetical protein
MTTFEHVAHIIYKGTIVHGAIFTVFSLWKRKWPLAQKLGAVELFAWVTAAWITHAWTFGRMPVLGPYETALSLAFIGGLVTFGMSLLHKAPYMAFYPAAVFVLLLHGNRYEPGSGIAAPGAFAVLHFLVAYAVAGLALALMAGALLILFKKDAPLRGVFLCAYISYSATVFLAVAFRLMTYGISGPLDPMEMIHLSTFLLFSMLIAVAAWKRWEGRAPAICGLIGSLVVLISYRLVLLLPAGSSYHR